LFCERWSRTCICTNRFVPPGLNVPRSPLAIPQRLPPRGPARFLFDSRPHAPTITAADCSKFDAWLHRPYTFPVLPSTVANPHQPAMEFIDEKTVRFAPPLMHALTRGDVGSWAYVSDVADAVAGMCLRPGGNEAVCVDMNVLPVCVEGADVVLSNGALMFHACTLINLKHGLDLYVAWRLLAVAAAREAQRVRDRGVLPLKKDTDNITDPRMRHWNGAAGTFYYTYEPIITDRDLNLLRHA